MIDVIIPTWAEVNFWIALVLASVVFMGFALIKAKREERTVTWMRDFEEPNIKEDW